MGHTVWLDRTSSAKLVLLSTWSTNVVSRATLSRICFTRLCKLESARA
jgi:hypothetical protein